MRQPRAKPAKLPVLSFTVVLGCPVGVGPRSRSVQAGFGVDLAIGVLTANSCVFKINATKEEYLFMSQHPSCISSGSVALRKRHGHYMVDFTLRLS